MVILYNVTSLVYLFLTALQSEYTTTKQALEQQQERYSALQAEHSQLLEQHQQNKQLITQLESDLSLVRPLLPTGDVSVTCCVKTNVIVASLEQH